MTIGTLDGANIEIRNEVGPENFFCFGMTVEEVVARKARGYDPEQIVQQEPAIRRALDHLSDGTFSNGDTQLFRPLVENLRRSDPFMVLADYAAYVACQEQVGRTYQDPNRWARMSILNVSQMGWFSSDRSIRDYCREIWKIESVPIEE